MMQGMRRIWLRHSDDARPIFYRAVLGGT
jgi:hypothetical protein